MSSGAWAFFGVLAGVIATLASTWLKHHLAHRGRARADKKRKELLRKMLQRDHYPWRKISTLSRVIGSSEQKTRRLLIEIGARASTKLAADDTERWGLLSRHPLPTDDETTSD